MSDKSLLPALFCASSLSVLAGPAETVGVSPQLETFPTWTLSLEALYLEARGALASFEDQDHEFGGRFELAHHFSRNDGVRARYFSFEGTQSSSSIDEWGPDLSTADLEYFRLFRWSGNTALVSAGARYLSYDERFDFGADLDTKFDGVGPTLGVELERPIAQGVAFFGKGRASYIFGNADGFALSNNEGFVAEVSAGLSYSFAVSGIPTTISLAYEYHFYDSFATDAVGDIQNAFLSGVSLGVQLEF